MKLLIDMNLSPAWVEALGQKGIAAIHWSSIGVADAEDTVIMAYARRHRCIVLTHDLDLGTLLAHSKMWGRVLCRFGRRIYRHIPLRPCWFQRSSSSRTY